jgi:hypothetical protein
VEWTHWIAGGPRAERTVAAAGMRRAAHNACPAGYDAEDPSVELVGPLAAPCQNAFTRAVDDGGDDWRFRIFNQWNRTISERSANRRPHAGRERRMSRARPDLSAPSIIGALQRNASGATARWRRRWRRTDSRLLLAFARWHTLVGDFARLAASHVIFLSGGKRSVARLSLIRHARYERDAPREGPGPPGPRRLQQNAVARHAAASASSAEQREATGPSHRRAGRQRSGRRVRPKFKPGINGVHTRRGSICDTRPRLEGLDLCSPLLSASEASRRDLEVTRPSVHPASPCSSLLGGALR